jgi:hypothetical protein
LRLSSLLQELLGGLITPLRGRTLEFMRRFMISGRIGLYRILAKYSR